MFQFVFPKDFSLLKSVSKQQSPATSVCPGLSIALRRHVDMLCCQWTVLIADFKSRQKKQKSSRENKGRKGFREGCIGRRHRRRGHHRGVGWVQCCVAWCALGLLSCYFQCCLLIRRLLWSLPWVTFLIWHDKLISTFRFYNCLHPRTMIYLPCALGFNHSR